ncbi:AMP-binding protein [Oceanibacterium hippocampi]|uniref:Putative sulfoacetate--CoA ligase n=1 Tax=Oceanibacterium hippocampi TaxID=745714 RepID=A0A1Y5SMU4_9PROT|nr:AMP-binding protein [Oceanibacterium hippocampi]SLN44347.1 putative sulfoacetate--CoA ligase [Oceanibacterium hippocampi]
MRSVYEAFLDSVGAAPGNAFLAVPPAPGRRYHPDGLELSYGEAHAAVEALKTAYGEAGYGPGHRVAVLLENRPDHFLHSLALNGLGVSVVPINPDYRDDEALYLLEHSEAALVVSVPERADDMRRVAAGRAMPLPVVEAGAAPGILAGLLPAAATPAGRAVPDLATEASLLYTSGTTGRPKGCILTNDYHLTAGRWYAGLGGLLTIRPGEDRIYNPLPIFHMNAGVVSFVCMLLTRNCLISPDRFHPATWWDDVAATGATIIHYLGVVPPMLLNQPPTRAERAHRVRVGLGAGVEPELHGAFEVRFGFPLVEVWGMTETGRIFADNHEPRQIDTRAFGRPHDDFQARVVDDSGQEAPAGEPGELLVRADADDPRRGFFAGYLKNEAATEEAWQGGWFHTGDIVRQGADGMLYFVDRKKNIIRRSGENIAAAEIEATLQAHDAVRQVAVIAAPDELREEEVMACIVPMAGETPDAALAERLFAWCVERLAYFKTPGWILFVETLPTTGTQKVQKTQIFPPGEDPRQRPGALDYRDRKRRRKRA